MAGFRLTSPQPEPSTHRHILVFHRHPDWHGHCDPHRRGFKRCHRWHWHIWYRHDHDD